MASLNLDEDSIDEILYLARANEASELSTFLDELATSTNQAKPSILAAAIDPNTKNTALHYAAANGHVDIIKLLLSFGSTTGTAPPSSSASGLINACNDSGNTALHWAALNGHLESVKALVQSGADVTIINKAGHDAVFEAEINDKGDVVEWLLAAVEELEKGIGQENEQGGESRDADESGTVENGQGSAKGVEDVRKQMEGLDTKDPSQGD
ncbi:ankyrin [Periconia macrospinosa]|uniref:Ankyrin n=1 Tax=Periconia macrospinosa TaxID=97972 RepID=A0A2V1DQT5_9PLEO|nr:ankyrin [Periconia macrospinosa]